MDASIDSKPEQTQLSTEDLPKFPTAEQMEGWGRDKVCRWIDKRHSDILGDNDLDNFKKACIGGRAFIHSSYDFFRKDCGLTPGASLGLSILVDEVKEGKRSNQTAGKRRKGDEVDAPEPSTSPKKGRQEPLLLDHATKARKLRKRIKEAITDLNDSSDQHSNSVDSLSKAVEPLPQPLPQPLPEAVDPLPGAVDKLSDPTFKGEFAFPFIGLVPERFKLDDMGQGYWSYEGRTKFKELLKRLKKVRKDRAHNIAWLYGTQGYGKSHLLAALVCYLAAQNERVIYIPDCRECLRNPPRYFKKAMLFAWADDTTTQEEILQLNTEDDIEAFLSRQKNVIVVADQLNALTETDCSGEETKKRSSLYALLMSLTSEHIAVFSSSANYEEYLALAEMQSSFDKFNVYGGLDRAEMDEWWKRHDKIDMGGLKKSVVEDITGSIPLLLDQCVVGGKIDMNVAYLRDIRHKAVSFVQNIRTMTKGEGNDWLWYTDSVKACLSRQKVSIGWPGRHKLKLIDHRHFYRDDNDIGGYTCGLVRDAVGEQFLKWNVNFADTNFLYSLPNFINNGSVTGFMIEKAVLSSIASHGLNIHADIGASMQIRLFRDFSIATDIIGVPVLYCPEKTNHEAIDGIIVLIKYDRQKEPPHQKHEKRNNAKGDKKEKEKDDKEDKEDKEDEEDKEDKEDKEDNNKKKKLFLFPLQITVALEGHSDSHAKFFDHYYDRWTKGLSNFDVEPQFLWITPDRHDIITHEASEGKFPKHKERYIHLRTVNDEIWQKYQLAKGNTG